MSIEYNQLTELERRIEEKKRKKKQEGTQKRRPGRPRKNKKEEEKPSGMRELVDPETGEIVDAIIPGEGSIIIDQKQQQKKLEKQLAQEMYEKSKEGDPFVQTSANYREYVNELSQAELHYLLLLMPLVQYNEKPIKKDGKLLKLGAIYDDVWKISEEAGSKHIQSFVKHGIAELKGTKTSIREKHLVIKKNFWFKGIKDFDGYNTKVVDKKMNEIIESVNEQMQRYIKENDLHPTNHNLFPLSLLGVLLAHIQFETFFLVREPDKSILHKEGETVQEVLKSHYKRNQRLKFMNKKEIWGKITGNQIKKLETAQSRKLDLYFQMLLNAGALITLQGKESRMIMHPELAFVTPRTKDTPWYQTVELLFSITEPGNDLPPKDKPTKKQG
ncbi:hypothetical protein [Bacillus thuringiensis]|uniref:hypothetical protein n=1 Tax=Bacillus thuringiensis TaxID=1428 RepID=UPI00119CBFBE|nr:hypothetical protein [Bacillus thuringiensis]